ncbi:MAG: hypothetical protein COV75_04855 [Candidatus Omnitrophica bacterium CG11_big_fil_rev_8_21_14_0_20_63_9]|nr:MAG: hypothetical protein COV75_04855 [Candidatus Omnitrophica bacterium CG11_big_fil_rev_8_21_14_0_20_63_9]
MAKRREPSSRLQQVGILTAIPFVLLVGPALGYYLGTAVDHRWSSEPWGMTIGVILGLAASVRSVAQFIQQSRKLEDDDDH